MSNDSKKLLTLGNVEAIKDYIDVSSNNIKYYVDEEFKNAVNTRIQEATTAVNNSFIAKTTEITNKITLLEQTTGNKNEINELKLQLDAVKADNNAMNAALEALSAELEAGLNDVSGSIMSAGQINDLVSTALINSVNVSSDAVEAPTVYTQNLVALIGKFGQIKATNITGSEISGKTVKSTSGSWELNNNGAGKLANGNITWNENGNVTFGPGVKLNWGNIEGSDDATNGVEAAMSAATAAAAAAATAQASANEATALANEAKNSIPSEERITEITRNSITTENITGTTLSGKTIKSTDDKWELTSTGAGKLANGNITWTEDGVVTFSDNVELKWGNITDAPTIPEGGGGLSETEVNNLIATQITNSGITANTIEGKTIKQHGENPKWSLNNDGSGHLGKFGDTKSIEWNADGVKIQGENVEISGDVKINGQAILDGVKSDESIQTQFAELTAEKISADLIIGDEIVGKTVKSTINETTGKPAWQLNMDGSAEFCNGTIQFNSDKTSITIDSPDTSSREAHITLSNDNGLNTRCSTISNNPYCLEHDKDLDIDSRHNAWNISIGGNCNAYAGYIGRADWCMCPSIPSTGIFVNGRPYDRVMDFYGGGSVSHMRKFTINLSTLLSLADAYNAENANNPNYPETYDNKTIYGYIYGSSYNSDWSAAKNAGDTELQQFYKDRLNGMLTRTEVYGDSTYTSNGPVYDIMHSETIYKLAKTLTLWNNFDNSGNIVGPIKLQTNYLYGVNNLICDVDYDVNIYLDRSPAPGEEINIIKCTSKTIKVFIPAISSDACDEKLSPSVSTIDKNLAYKYKAKLVSTNKYITSTVADDSTSFGINDWFYSSCAANKTNLIFAGNLVNDTGTWYIS